MKFDFIIGNPPYQEEVENNGRTNPIYHMFMSEAYKTGNIVELITPARFLFNAGLTPKAWNKKMLNDPHLKVLYYNENADEIFSNTDIKGGIAITYHNANEQYEPINIFFRYNVLKSILHKIINNDTFISLTDSIVGAVPYRFSDCLKNEHPECIELAGNSFDLRSNVFDKLNNIIFFDNIPIDNNEYVKIVGLCNKKRTIKYIAKKYLNVPNNFEYYKAILPKSNGSGAFGEILATPFLGEPLMGHTQSFISIGKLNSETETNALLKYIKAKFTRAMLGILKATQDNSRAVWKYVPLQDFTSESDIDWSQSISDIDQQLYTKYDLDEDEITFIESHVKEMD